MNFLRFFKTLHIFVQLSIRSSMFSGLFFNTLYVIVFKLWDLLKVIGLQIKFDFRSDPVNMTYLIAEIRSNTYFAFLASIFIIFYSDLGIRYLVVRDTTYIPGFAEIKNLNFLRFFKTLHIFVLSSIQSSKFVCGTVFYAPIWTLVCVMAGISVHHD